MNDLLQFVLEEKYLGVRFRGVLRPHGSNQTRDLRHIGRMLYFRFGEQSHLLQMRSALCMRDQCVKLVKHEAWQEAVNDCV